MRECKTCDTLVTNTKTYCVDCVEVRRLTAILKQTEERKGRTRRARLAENKKFIPLKYLVRGSISDTSPRSQFG